ncbi:MAG: hypothetical protein GX272_09400 [Epulopiscium sp.]|nr:hypothetical protein [Candidatus Epulonipiscium sp.]
MIASVQNRDLVIRQNEIDVSTSMPRDWKQGDVLEGKIISCEENTAIIEIEGNQLQVKTSQKLGEEGSTLKLKVESISKGEVRLKPMEKEEIRPIKQYDRIKSILRKEAIPISEQNIEIAQKMIENGVTVEKEIFDKVIQAKKQIDQLINTMTREEVKELLESPYDIEKISIDVVTRFLSKSGRTKQKISDKEIEEELKNYIDHEEKNIKKAVKALLENDLPVTKKNIDSLILVQEKIETVKTMDDKAIAQFIKRDLPATLNNVYASVFSSGKEEPSTKSKSPYQDVGMHFEPVDFEVTKEEIISLLKAQQIPTEEEYIEAAEILIKNHIEVDKEKVQAIVTLKRQISRINEEDLLDQSAQLLKENKNPGKIELIDHQYRPVEKPLTHEEMKQLLQDIKEIDDEDIKKLIKRNMPINLKNLRGEKGSEIKDEVKLEKESIEQNPSFITAKRQLEEIRLKMTLEAAVKLNQKIQIDTAPLKEVVEELKALEKEYYGDCLKKAGAEPSKENIEQLEALYKKIEGIKELDERVLPKVIKKEINFIIDDLYKEQLKEEIIEPFKAETAVSAYEEMHTKPEQRFGDTIRKIENQIETLLKDQEIEPTKENIRCARILIQNAIDVTEENILHLKLLDEKVNYVGANLHPTIAAEMIKEGFRPDQIPIDEVIDYIKDFEEILGSDVRDKLNEFILQMDEDKALTQEEREGMIGIYRMLHTIEKSNGKVIGWLMKNNMSLTLNNLMEGAKYLARTGGRRQDMDVSIDDEFGVIKELNFPEKSIKAQLEKAFGVKENITELKRMDMRIPSVQENLRLNNEEGIRTIHQTIDYIREVAVQREDVLGEALQEELTDFLGQIDKAMSLTKEQKESLINIYNALKKLEISNTNQEVIDPKVLGDLYKEEILEAISNQSNEEVLLKDQNVERSQEAGLKEIEEEQIKSVLKEAEIEPTKENIRYGKILRQNNIEVTKENIIELKRLDIQTLPIQENLQLNNEEGIRTINQAIDYIRETAVQREDILGEVLQKELTEFLGQIDKAVALTKEQKESLINVYNALNKLEISTINQEVISLKILEDLYKEEILEAISNQSNEEVSLKDQGAKISQETRLKEIEEEQIKSVLKEVELELTKENIRYGKILRQNDIEVTKQNILSLKNLDNQIMQNLQVGVTTEMIKLDYFERIVEDFSKLASPEQLKEWLNSNPDFLEEDLETIYREYVKEEFIKKSFLPNALVESAYDFSSVTDEDIKEFLNTIGSLKKVKQATLIFMEKNQIPVNIKNLQIVSSMIENPFEFGDNLEKLNEIIKESSAKEDIHKIIREAVNDLKNDKEVEEVLDEVKEKVKEIKEDLLNSSSGQKQNAWKTGNDIEKIMDIQKQIQKQEGFYQIPILINDKITNMNIYVMKDRKNEKQLQKEGLSAFISMDTEHLGTIRMYIHMDEKNVDFKISGESKEITDYLKSQEGSLRNSIEQIGYKVVKGQIKEEVNENIDKNPLLIPIKKHLDSGFEIII